MGGNLFVEPCSSCNYDSDAAGLLCRRAGQLSSIREQRNGLGFRLLPLATGVPKQISVPIIVADPRNCPTREVTLSIYTDACYPSRAGNTAGLGCCQQVTARHLQHGSGQINECPDARKKSKILGGGDDFGRSVRLGRELVCF